MSSRPQKRTLLAWRESKDYTLRQAADELGLPLTTYYSIERGVQIPRRDVMKRLIKLTGVPAEVLAQVA